MADATDRGGMLVGMPDVEPAAYAAALEEIKRRVHEARYRAQRRANTELIRLYWQIGRTILDR